jgi:hypothetical protein
MIENLLRGFHKKPEAINWFCVFKFLMRNWQSAFNKWREINSGLWKTGREETRRGASLNGNILPITN